MTGKSQNPIGRHCSSSTLPIWGLPDWFHWQNWLPRRVDIISESHKEHFLLAVAILKVF